jgi:hypothetical protein
MANAQCYAKLRVLGDEVVPRLKGEWVKRMSKHFLELRGAVDEVADRCIAFLNRHQQQQNDKGMGYIQELRAGLQECAYVSPEEIETIIADQCVVEVTKISEWVGKLKRRMERALIAEEARVHRPALAMAEFYLQSADHYVRFEVCRLASFFLFFSFFFFLFHS